LKRPRWYILDADRQAVAVDAIYDWAQWAADHPGSLRVAHDNLAGALISTVFLGLDHSHGTGPPLLFETMTFDDYGVRGQRYSTWRQAIEGHRQLVASAKSASTKGA
jgi:hypothetical protein